MFEEAGITRPQLNLMCPDFQFSFLPEKISYRWVGRWLVYIKRYTAREPDGELHLPQDDITIRYQAPGTPNLS